MTTPPPTPASVCREAAQQLKQHKVIGRFQWSSTGKGVFGQPVMVENPLVAQLNELADLLDQISPEDVGMLRSVQIADYRGDYRRSFDLLADRLTALTSPIKETT